MLLHRVLFTKVTISYTIWKKEMLGLYTVYHECHSLDKIKIVQKNKISLEKIKLVQKKLKQFRKNKISLEKIKLVQKKLKQFRKN